MKLAGTTFHEVLFKFALVARLTGAMMLDSGIREYIGVYTQEQTARTLLQSNQMVGFCRRCLAYMRQAQKK